MTRDEQIEKAANAIYEPLHPAWSGTENQAFQSGAEWADLNPCHHSWEPNTTMTVMRCEWCGIEADKTSEKNQLRAKLDIAVKAMTPLAKDHQDEETRNHLRIALEKMGFPIDPFDKSHTVLLVNQVGLEAGKK